MLSFAFLLAVAFSSGSPGTNPALCSVRELRASPGYRYRVERIREFIDSATVIVRTTAMGPDTLGVRPTEPDSFAPVRSSVVFQVLETLRGTVPNDRLVLPGTLVDRDDFNRGAVPYTIVRHAGQRGDCEAREYRVGGQYLFILRPSRAGSGLTPYWRPLAPF